MNKNHSAGSLAFGNHSADILGFASGNHSAGSLAFGYQGAEGERSSGVAGCGGFGRHRGGRFSRTIRDFVPSRGG